MLRDSEAAADVTQEVFVSALGQLHRARADRISGWIYRIATNAAYKHLRTQRRRNERERHVAAQRDSSQPASQNLDELEARQVLESHVQALPDEPRALVLLHYYSGLTQRQIAAALSWPRTTVASRLIRAVEQLRSTLQNAGQLALMPILDRLLRTPPPLLVPAALQSELLTAATAVAIPAAPFLGGLVLMPKFMLAAGLCTLIALVAGYSGNRWARSSGQELAQELRSDLDLATASNVTLERTNVSLRDAIETERAAHHQTALALTAAQDDAKAGAGTPTPASALVQPAAGLAGIDWQALGDRVADNRDVYEALANAIARGDSVRDLDPALLLRQRALINELDKAAAQAQLESPYPMLDERFLPRILEVYFRGLTDMNSDLMASVIDASNERLRDLDLPEDTTPLEAYRARQEVLGGVSGLIESYASQDDADHWRRMVPLWQNVVQGSHRSLKIGLETTDPTSRVLGEWNTHYRFEPDQKDRVAAILSDYMGQVQVAIARQAEQPSDSGIDFYRLQRQAEEQLLALLSSDQIAALQQRLPLLLTFESSGSISITDDRNSGF